ncbi:MAG: 6-bladed beta-propeller [Planctomycetota bacterium]|jgi:sugar lactone lactonase YvrE
MSAKKLLIVIALFLVFTSYIEAKQEYHVVKIWPEAPQGWHFFKPRGVAVDNSGNVYIGDSGNYRVKKFDSEGRFITQWGSPGSKDGQFETIGSIKVDSAGTVYVEDTDFGKWEHSRIQKFTPYGQYIGKLERTAPDAHKIKQSIDIAFDNKGNILVLAVDYRPKPQNRTYGVRIEKYSKDGKFISQWEGEAGSGDGQFQRPNSIDVDTEGNIYITGLNNNRVQKFDSSGKFLTKWGAKGKEDGFFGGGARSIDFDKMGYIYVLDYNSVQKFTPAGEFIARWKTKSKQANRLAVDSNSNIYVTDLNSHVVAKIDPEGNVISQWGCATTGDGLFSLPGSIAVDSLGNTVVADVDNNRIQRFDSECKFLSHWGGRRNWPWIASLATDVLGNLYIACCGPDEVQKYNPDGKLIDRWGSTGSNDGQFSYAPSIAIGPSGNLYMADSRNCRVQKFTNDGKLLTKWGTKGAGDGQFDRPFFIAVDGSGNVWVADQLEKAGNKFGNGTHRMQKFDTNGRFLTKWTKRIMIPPRIAHFGALTVDSSGNSFYAFESKIEKYNSEGNLISSFGQEVFTKDKLGKVQSMYVDKEGYLYISGPADPLLRGAGASGSIRKYNPNGKLISKLTAEDMEVKGKLPNGPITVDGTGNMYVSYLAGIVVSKLSSDGKFVTEFQIEPPLGGGGFSILGGVAIDSSNCVYAVNSVDADWGFGIPSIKKFDSSSQFITMWGVPEKAKGKFKYPAQIAVDSSGNAYVTDYSSHCIHKLDDQGKYIKSWGSKGTGDGQFDTPEGIAVDKSGTIYVCDRQNSRIQKFDSNGRFLIKWGKQGSAKGEFHFPAAVALDKKGNVYVADSNNNRIQKFTHEGNFLTEWGEFGEAPGQFNVPLGIAIDASGNVYVSDSHNHRIQKFAPPNP